MSSACLSAEIALVISNRISILPWMRRATAEVFLSFCRTQSSQQAAHNARSRVFEQETFH
jgi:hypothetical protein